ncbi:PhzF family phenazine biosynthesis protein [Actinocorallia herbida]|uniref:PhzF family phenazine biosynthesis protein n=1 Tax=Actinocorallia herbida TaxID=58109 RepID=A0A3N1D696_9ACTN|nr:PhzF family phenazine biosynthesis protein [Actinocorallia herbida]ROO89040.1 PhzF family phenazine biosynthesis protein [Actinocorallia herbida]
MSLEYRHVDVFAAEPFTGNSLAVFPDRPDLTGAQMLAVTQELRHFETIFLRPTDAPDAFEARVFDLIEELDFAGHPILGAAAVLHERAGGAGTREWRFRLPRKTVQVTTRHTEGHFQAALDQGRPEFLGTVPPDGRAEIAEALRLPSGALADLPLEVVSTGLRYLVVPVRGRLVEARIVRQDFADLLARHGAQFAYLLDVDGLEGRHWNNDGVMEDVATGSAAGCVGAYLARHGVVPAGREFILRQGRFTGRPSRIGVLPEGSPDDLENIRVSGAVAMTARGTLDAVPAKTEES